MVYRVLADLVVVVHFAFILFVVAGGFLAIRRPRLAWIHLPAALWGALVELQGWYCPLTPLENRLRLLGRTPGYAGSFVERYLLPVIYPGGLTRDIQLVLGIGVIGVNVVAYGFVIRALLATRASG